MSKQPKTQSTKRPLPNLPRGEGSMSYDQKGYILYKKTLKVGGGSVRVGVRGKTAAEAMRAMKEKEKEILLTNGIGAANENLYDGLMRWMMFYRQPELKPKSYDRIITTITNQIKPYPISILPWTSITSVAVQGHIQILVGEHLSWSTIKKVYDILNGFYRWQFEHQKISFNIMVDVRMPIQDNVLKPKKSIAYLTEDEIAKFKTEAFKICKTQNRPLHQYGAAFVFVIYTGIRVGELLALRWSDIDFERRTMSITKSVEEIINREFDENDKDKMAELGITRRIQKEGSTKNYSSRMIALNPMAMESLQFHYKYSNHKDQTDYVFGTKYGTLNNEHNMYRRLTDILKLCDISIDQAGCHMLRHTCASLLFKKGNSVELIAKVLGHSPDVCRKTYIHFCLEQEAQAMHSIAEYNI